MAKRTPLCKAYKGAYKDMRVDELMTSTFKAILKEMPMKLNEIEDICVGVVQGQITSGLHLHGLMIAWQVRTMRLLRGQLH